MATVTSAAADPATSLSPGHWFTVAASAARAAANTYQWDFENFSGQSLIVVIDATALADTPSVVFTIQGIDPVSGKTWDILASAAVVATGTTVLRVSPHLTAAANTIAKDIVPARLRIKAVHADADSITYSVAAQYTA